MPNLVCPQCGVTFLGRSRNTYCSIPCANIGMRKANPSSRYAKSKLPEGHPLRDRHGQCMTHRLVLWSKIGPGEHPCHHCGTSVTWKPNQLLTATSLVAEHVDGNTRNNDSANIVPSCQKCNINKARHVIGGDELFVVHSDGTRQRGRNRECPRCGKTFVVRLNAGPEEGKYCSVPCARPRVKGKTKNCAECGAEFLTYSDGSCCSRPCADVHRRGKPRPPRKVLLAEQLT